MIKIILITDGACSGNPGPGGWGVILKEGVSTKELHGGEKNTTNNKMELTAVIKGFELINEAAEVIVKTDSTYLINGITKWLPKWKSNGWMTSSKKPVANKDLWIALEDLITYHKVDWIWVRGHAGDVDNERADFLARKGAQEILMS